MESWHKWLMDLIDNAKQSRFFGKIVLTFEGGRLVHLKKEETFNPPVNEGNKN